MPLWIFFVRSLAAKQNTMPFEQLLTKVIKRRKPDRGKSDGKGIDGKGEGFTSMPSDIAHGATERALAGWVHNPTSSSKPPAALCTADLHF